MKILLISNYTKDQQFSMQKFSACIEEGLIQKKHEVKTCKPYPIFGWPFKSTVNGLAKWLGYIDKYFIFPFVLMKTAQSSDIIHICDHSNAIYVQYIKKYPHLVTCHDLMAVRSALGEFEDNNQSSKTGKLQQRLILKGLQAARHIASVSNATNKDVLRLTKQSADNVSVIHNGLNYTYNPAPKDQALLLLAKYGITANVRFLLHVGGNQWYKNRKGLLSIFAEIVKQRPDNDLKLVMAGKPLTDELHNLIQQSGLKEKVIEVKEPSTEDLHAFYSLATAFIFPSLCEGFGWPIIEAQACNALVFTSDREPMTEVGGDAAVYFDPNSPDKAAKLIINTLESSKIINEVLNANSANLLKFTTESMVEKYLSLYQEILLNRVS